MKFRGHETFFIRRGWLTKGLKYVSRKADIFVTRTERPMDILGLGTNMVKSLRYWLQAVGLTVEPNSGKRVQNLTKLGEIIYKYDRYIEECGTLALLQYKLACNETEATSWYFFFNEFGLREFSQEDFISMIKSYAKNRGKEIADRSYSDDFNCIIGTYIAKEKSVSPEESIVSPFSELGLIREISRGVYQKSTVKTENLPLAIVLAIILDIADGKCEVKLEKLLSKPRSIGCAFNLNTAMLLEILQRLEDNGTLKLVRTAGLDVVNILTDKTSEQVIEEYYLALN